MTNEQFEQIEEYEWSKFCKQYSHVVSSNWFSKFTLIFFHKGVQRLLWENGYRRGWVNALEFRQEMKEEFHQQMKGKEK
jgi:hypothetical protein